MTMTMITQTTATTMTQNNTSSIMLWVNHRTRHILRSTLHIQMTLRTRFLCRRR